MGWFDCVVIAQLKIATVRAEEQEATFVLLMYIGAYLFHCKASQDVSRKMRIEKINCNRENILYFTVFEL